MNALGFLLCACAIVLSVPVTVFLLQAVLALPPLRPGRAPQPAIPAQRSRLVVLVPAHNEEAVIADTLRALMPQIGQGDRVVVVADNCSDSTRAIAEAGGAEVLVRTDAVRRGKGYALDFGVRHLEHDPPEMVVIVDADCHVTAGAVDVLARKCSQSGRPVQALYLMGTPEGAGLRLRVAGFAWVTRNLVRPLGFLRLGLPCQLMGTGMAIPWNALKGVSLASGHIVEDMLLGINLALAGTPPLFCPDAVVSSTFPATEDGATGQRTRWEHGHLGVILVDAPRLLVRAVAGRSLALLAMALDLCVPPIALLALTVTVLLAAASALLLCGGMAAPLALAVVLLLMTGGAVFIAWAGHGWKVISLASLAFAPVYALGKIPLYARFVAKRQVEWIRSSRERG
ncbi:MAG: glycosyltransferase family 2 protein [Betaproteobacteria bacterium]